jgi:DNA-binding NtrC family response regulator
MIAEPQQDTLNILLADDDTDDCHFFEKVLKEIPIATRLTTFQDGEQLMNFLSLNSECLPDILFLDLAMPRKNGFECLVEIHRHNKLKGLPVFVFTVSFRNNMNFESNIEAMLQEMGAYGYIRKNSDFSQLKVVLHNALMSVAKKMYS